MDNISGKANYTSDQDIAKSKTTRKKKTIKEKVSEKLESTTVKVNKDPIYQKAIELHRDIESEYQKTNKKKLYDALMSAQSMIEALRDIV